MSATGQYEQAVSTLNNLIRTCIDAQEGFHAASEALQEPSLRTLFRDYSRQRAQLTDELQIEVRRLGGDPATGGSIAGALHRGWLVVKSAFAGKNDSSIIAECERGEDEAVERYLEAMSSSLPAAAMQIVSRQYEVIRATHDRVHELELAHT